MLNEYSNDDAMILGAAMRCFWRHGFEAYDFDTLATDLGLTRQHLNDRFGNKRVLFQRALAYYIAYGFDEEMTPLERDRSPSGTLDAIFERLIEHVVAPQRHDAGVLFGEALEIAPHDGAFQQAIREVLIRIEAFLYRCVAAGQLQGEIVDTSPPEDLAKLLLGAMLGIRILSRAGAGREELEAIARSALSVVTYDAMQG